ncbi:MerR family DNA-binding transcriptional regulator [Pontibacterium sp.]|uniref:MerR family DNA-binding transcriptional regulator n=1 Tax=Pontibacterium sp. TaxID=2036026 RepID=UPI00356A44DA
MELNGNLSNLPPFMDQKEFADRVGVSTDQVRHYVKEGYLPTVKLSNGSTASKRTFINCISLQQWLSEKGQEWVHQQLEGVSR